MSSALCSVYTQEQLTDKDNNPSRALHHPHTQLILQVGLGVILEKCLMLNFSLEIMSLLNMLSGIMDQHGDTVQQAALLAYLKQGEEAQPYLEAVLAARLAGTVYKTLSKDDQYEAARNETILSIAKWVKEHPRATQV